MFTTDGIAIEVIDPGVHNKDAGPDFFNAKLRIGDKIWAGNVEIHLNTSDWNKHKHHQDKAYDSVILHVVERKDIPCVKDTNDRVVPEWIMSVPQTIKDKFDYLLNVDIPIPCLDRIRHIDSIYLSDWMSALLSERLERKTNTILQLLDTYNNDWNEVFYITLSRNFGFGINNDVFERLAKSLPLKIIHKHADSRAQVEALFFGQAGLLSETIEDDYYNVLKKEYLFLKNKYSLQPLDSYLFKSLRIRPNNFPHVKIAQLASIVSSGQHLLSKILAIKNPSYYSTVFITSLPEYWNTHYAFGTESINKPKSLGTSSIHILLINTVAPLLFAYGKLKESVAYMDRAFTLLEILPPEKNFITKDFLLGGLSCKSAADSQSMIQLKREYCEKKKCMYCRIGYKVLL